jgi:8-oxo-dGTP pyrophosphatase MutT (NUDIX family)
VSAAPAVPRDASTVLLLRDGDVGIEVWMMRRRSDLAFAADAWVFPGGAVVDDPRDARGLRSDGPAWEVLAGLLGTDARRCEVLMEAAVREVFEECGVVLARTETGAPPAWGDGERRLLLTGGATLPELLDRDRCAISTSVLVPWAWWLTPEWSARRYDTWFFAVDATAWPEPEHIADGEAVASGWVVPEVLLAEAADAPGLLLPPTVDALVRLTRSSTVEQALADAPASLARRSG